MGAMSMGFEIGDVPAPALADGDRIVATLVVSDTKSWLEDVKVIGRSGAHGTRTPTPGHAMPGVLAPDLPLLDQNGRPTGLRAFAGRVLVVSFIYTRCPLPDFCPLMDRNFASIQKTIASTPALADVRLLTVTLDPDFDRPAILKAHARRREADPAIWTFLTGDPTEVNKFASQFGLYVEHNPQNAIDITHNLRTAVIDPEGRLVTAHSGNSWTPAELVADLSAAPAPTH